MLGGYHCLPFSWKISAFSYIFVGFILIVRSTRENSRESNNEEPNEMMKSSRGKKESKSNKGGRSIKKFNIFVNACIKIS